MLLDMGDFVASGDPKAIVDQYNRLLVECSRQAEVEKKKLQENIQNISIGSLPLQLQAEDRTDFQLDGIEVPVNVNPKENRYGNKKGEVVDFGVRCTSGNISYFLHGEEYIFWLKARLYTTVKNPVFSFTIKDTKGFDVTGTNTLYKKIDTGEFQEETKFLWLFVTNFFLILVDICFLLVVLVLKGEHMLFMIGDSMLFPLK